MSPRQVAPGSQASPREAIRGTQARGRSPRVIAETMAQMLPGVISRAPWLNDELYEDERQRYLRASAVSELLSNYILGVSENEGIEHVAAASSSSTSQHPPRLAAGRQARDDTAVLRRDSQHHRLDAESRAHPPGDAGERAVRERARPGAAPARSRTVGAALSPGEIGPPDVLRTPPAPSRGMRPRCGDPEDSPA